MRRKWYKYILKKSPMIKSQHTYIVVHILSHLPRQPIPLIFKPLLEQPCGSKMYYLQIEVATKKNVITKVSALLNIKVGNTTSEEHVSFTHNVWLNE